jgi:hypothetical protein
LTREPEVLLLLGLLSMFSGWDELPLLEMAEERVADDPEETTDEEAWRGRC